MKKETKKERYERETGQGFGSFINQGTTLINGVLTEQARLLTEAGLYLLTEDSKYITTE